MKRYQHNASMIGKFSNKQHLFHNFNLLEVSQSSDYKNINSACVQCMIDKIITIVMHLPHCVMTYIHIYVHVHLHVLVKYI